MARIAGSDGAQTAESIRRAGLRLIFERGFEGFGLRELARVVGVQPASLYNYFKSKQDLLFGLVDAHMDALIASAKAAVAECDADPVARLAAFSAHHMEYHIDKKHEVLVANFELRALSETNRKLVLAKRHRYEGMLIAILDEGRSAGVIGVADSHVAAYATLAMLTGACTWYRPTGRLARRDVTDLHVKMVLDGCLQRAPIKLRRELAPTTEAEVTPRRVIRKVGL